MGDNIARNISGIGYYEAISIFLDGIDTVFTEVQLSSHVNLTNLFSSISVTRANDFQTVFHDVEPATHENRNFEFLETSNFETVFSAAQLIAEANFTEVFTNVSISNVVFVVEFIFTCEQITRCLRLSSLYIENSFVHLDNVAIMATEDLFTNDSRLENEPDFTQAHITNVATVFSEDQIIRHEEFVFSTFLVIESFASYPH